MKSSKHRGVAAVEFAIILPLFVTLAIGMLDYGRAIQVKMIVTSAAREGARAFAVASTDADAAQKAVRDCLRNSGLDPAIADIEATLMPDPLDSMQEVAHVRVAIPFASVSWVGCIPLGTLDSETFMRRETVF